MRETETPKDWSYSEAFSRNRGLISVVEQEKLRHSRVAIAGMGGVGGVEVATLARLGISNFTIADFDTFGVGNTNRQYGAMKSTIGSFKTEVMASIIKDINPEAIVRIITEPVSGDNISDFLKDADIVIDGLDIFAIEARRIMFRTATNNGLHVITAGPLGFGTAWLIFGPGSMSFDNYYNFTDGLSNDELFYRFIVGTSPRGLTLLNYLNKADVDLKSHTGPSVGAATMLCAGVVASEVVKILLKRGRVRLAPRYQQFDVYKGKLVKGWMPGGNRHPLQRFKLAILRQYYLRRGTRAPSIL